MNETLQAIKMLLLTDGLPNCNENHASPYPGCRCTLESNDLCAAPYDKVGCLDDNGSVAAIKALKDGQVWDLVSEYMFNNGDALQSPQDSQQLQQDFFALPAVQRHPNRGPGPHPQRQGGRRQPLRRAGWPASADGSSADRRHPGDQTVSGSVATNQNVNYGPLSVVAGTTFKVVMTGSGDPDLYVRFGAQPTSSAYNCRPYVPGAAETCELSVPPGESSAYILVNGYSASSYSLTISYTKP